MKYYVIAGEASGDLHGSNLLYALKQKDPQADFRCWGGDLMEEAGGVIVKHYKDLAFMGFVEVILNLKTILYNISFCKEDIAAYKPDVVILIDYPGFNLRIAEYVHSLGIKVFYYICPQIWAWKQSRVKTIKKYVDRLFVILPFEKDFYAKHDVDVDFVGHPLLDAFQQKKESSLISEFLQHHNPNNKPIIALLPGSRRQEIKNMLALMTRLPKYFDDYIFIIAGTKHISTEFYEKNMKDKSIKIIVNQTYSLLEKSTAAVVASGTATLETALFKVPQVVCYKGNPLSIFIGRLLIKVNFISLVNLILDKEVVKELIQNDYNEVLLVQSLKNILPGSEKREEVLKQYFILDDKLGGVGASERTASKMVDYLKKD